jgi:Reverse transcriptase (RNA-dependent DNA polymerase)
LQEEGVHYSNDSLSAPVTNETAFKIIMALLVMANWKAHVIDVRGAFLKGNFDENEVMYLEVPEGFETNFEEVTVLESGRSYWWHFNQRDLGEVKQIQVFAHSKP